MNINTILMLLFNGILLGLIYAIVAIGFSLVLGIGQVINFAHGILFAFGAYIFWYISPTIGYWPAFIITPLIVGCMGYLIEKLVITRVYGQDPLFGLLVTFGISLSGAEAIRMIWGKLTKTVITPDFAAGRVYFFNTIFPKYRMILALISLIIILFVWWLITKSNFGTIVKAGMSDNEMISALGHNLPVLRNRVFIIGSILAGIAGIVAAPLWGIKSEMGTDILMLAFIITLIGGMGSIKGTIIAGIGIGIISSLGVLVIPRLIEAMPFILLIVVLFYKPKGLYGELTILGEVTTQDK
ncbi:MAG: branched-chain amino acid ABC transporter permease [Actinobacteria bacterium]|nr:branched-chain amino acid ABC transporter permease [Actinomycetota bacterium]MBE3138638.1 branched-chain amino acid ABC transporter permease [Actinomycetota bacterium]